MSDLDITAWKCPFCVAGIFADGGRCLHCAGTGLTDRPCGDAERAPRPPGVMRAPCADCAFRPGSPELEQAGVTLPQTEPFYCHQGLPVSAFGAYTPVATFRGLPLGAMVCAGWWANQTGEPLPTKAYREVPTDPAKHWDLPYVLRETGMSDAQREVLHAAGIGGDTAARCGATTELPYDTGTAVCTRRPHLPGDPWHNNGALTWQDLESGNRRPCTGPDADGEPVHVAAVDEMPAADRDAFAELVRAGKEQLLEELLPAGEQQ